MFPSRPRLRVGLSRRSTSSSRLTRPSSSSTPRTPFQPLRNGTSVQPARVSTRPGATSSKTTKASSEKGSKLYFSVLYTKNSKKKHKSWLDGFIVVIDDRNVVMHNEDGKRMLSERVPKLGGLVEGNTLELRSWMLEVQNPISEEDFISGRIFLKEAVTVQRFVPRQRRVFKPLRPHGAPQVPKKVGPLHDPNTPDAVVLAEGEIPVVLDPCLARRMRPHQKSGVKFLFGCVKTGNGAILADDMGLGKSLQAIALIWTLLLQGRSPGPLAAKAIIVCPASLVSNWVNEVKKWLGNERLKPVAVSSGSSTFESKQDLAAFVKGSVKKLMIVSYEMFRSYAEELYAADIGLLVCDEGHRLKSSQGNKTIEALKKLPCNRRVILTGTPVQNDLEEFFAVCDFVNPGCLNSLQSFRSIFAAPIIASRDSNASSSTVRLGKARARELGNVTSKFVLRRTSNILERYLPMKLETAIFCRLQPNQEKAYDTEAQYRYADMDSNRFSAALTAINYLRKICSHPSLIKSRNDLENGYHGDEYAQRAQTQNVKASPKAVNVNESSKMQIAISICEASLAINDRVIFVSNFTSTLDLVQQALVQKDIRFCRLDGSTPVTQRGDIVRRFNRGALGDIFLLSAKAGGIGLNLIGANRLILFDPDWNPATDLQAMARVWRDGQTKKVFVYRLLSTGTIEEKIFQRQLFKGELQTALGTDTDGARVHAIEAEGVLAGKEGNFSAEQLRDLFQYNGRHEFCETLQVLERSQLETEVESGFTGDDDFERDRAKQNGLLKRFSEYKERFENNNGVKDYILCDEDDVLNQALNNDLKTHGIVSYLFTQRSGSGKETENKCQSSSAERKLCEQTKRTLEVEKCASDNRVEDRTLKRRKLTPMFSKDADSDERDCESDAELAVLETMAKYESRRRARRNDSRQDEESAHKKPSVAGVGAENRNGDQVICNDNIVMVMKKSEVEKTNEKASAEEIEKSWDDAVKALDVDISEFL